MVNKYHKCLKNVRTTKKSFIRKHVKGTKICLSEEENERKHQYHCD